MLVTEKKGDILVTRMTETKLNAANAPAFREGMAKLIADGHKRFVIDMSRVTFVDSSGLGAMVGVLKRIGNAGDLAVTGLQPPVQRLFELTRMDRVFRIYDDAAAAIGGLAA